MANYQTKPVGIQAWQWDETITLRDKLQMFGMPWSGNEGHRDNPDLCQRMRVRFHDGPKYVALGDWIVRDEHGHWHLLTPGAFAQKYEPAPPLAEDERNGNVAEPIRTLLNAMTAD